MYKKPELKRQASIIVAFLPHWLIVNRIDSRENFESAMNIGSLTFSG